MDKFWLGKLVKLSRHPDSTVWMVKRIESEHGGLFLVAADGSGSIAGWVSANSVWSA